MRREHVLLELQVGTETGCHTCSGLPVMDASFSPIHSLKKNKKKQKNRFNTEQLVQKCFWIKVSGSHMTAGMNTMISISII